MKASRLLLLTMALTPAMLLADKTQDQLISIQRDVAQLEDSMRQLQKTLDDKVAAQSVLLQQALDALSKMAATIPAMQREIDQKLADQQTKLVAPVATLGTKVDEMSGDFRTVSEGVAELRRRMNDFDTKLTDISSAVRSLQAPPPGPPPAAGDGTTGTVPQAQDNTPPAGMSAELLYNNAYRDYSGKKYDLALDEFAQYGKYYPTSEKAPDAMYYMGQIYFQGQDWKNAIDAFDRVLEKFPKNMRTADAQYFKAMSLLKDGQKTDAGHEFIDFLAKYPDGPHAKEAHMHLQDLGMERRRRQ